MIDCPKTVVVSSGNYWWSNHVARVKARQGRAGREVLTSRADTRASEATCPWAEFLDRVDDEGVRVGGV